MKRLEEMSREELIEEAISNSKHLEEIEATRKEEECMIADLEKQVKLLEDITESISQGESGIAKAKPKLQELLKMKDRLAPELRKEAEALAKSCSLYEDTRRQLRIMKIKTLNHRHIR